MTRDPAGYGGGINLYGFAGDNPVNEMDPDGLDPSFVFDRDTIGSGLATGWAGFSTAVWGMPGLSQLNRRYSIYSAGDYANRPGYGVSVGLGTVGITALPLSAAPKVAMAFSAFRATGTVWRSIKATQAVYEGSTLPRSFVLTVEGGQKFWVHGNATEHIAEYLQSVAETHAPEAVRLVTQEMLTSLRAAVGAAQKQGIVYGKLMHIGGWELKFGLPRAAGQLPAIVHALYK